MSDSDVRITPGWLVDLVELFHGGTIDLDVCTEPGNPLAAKAWFTEADSGLADGASWLRFGSGNFLAWCNCPYSRGQVIQWARKAVHEATRGAEIIMLTKDDCRTSWSAYLRDNADMRCRIAKGVGFLEPDGDGGYKQLVGPAWGSCLWYWGRRRRRFHDVFSEIGEVTSFLGPKVEL